MRINPKIVTDIALMFGMSFAVYYTLEYFLNKVAADGPRSADSKKKSNASLEKLKERYPTLELDPDEYERIILQSVITPQDISVSFKDIGGLDNIIEELREAVLFPLTVPGLYSHQSKLLQAPKGVLLYGPPGCGKTMLAKALAAESSANFINIKMSTIMDKWFGESNKLVAAIFSLAHKLQPCIIFIDEIDSFLRERSSSDHEVTGMLKAEFMTLWDGLTSDGRILVLGATNRPNDIDNAILRRMPKRFAVSLPGSSERLKILKLLLTGSQLEPNFDFNKIVNQTAGMSGSDLKELCRNAAMVPVREFIKKNSVNLENFDKNQKIEVRPMKDTDFMAPVASEPHLPNNMIRDLD